MKFDDDLDIYQFGKYYYYRINRVSADGCHLIPLGKGLRRSGKSVPGVSLVWQGTYREFAERVSGREVQDV